MVYIFAAVFFNMYIVITVRLYMHCKRWVCINNTTEVIHHYMYWAMLKIVPFIVCKQLRCSHDNWKVGQDCSRLQLLCIIFIGNLYCLFCVNTNQINWKNNTYWEFFFQFPPDFNLICFTETLSASILIKLSNVSSLKLLFFYIFNG